MKAAVIVEPMDSAPAVAARPTIPPRAEQRQRWDSLERTLLSVVDQAIVSGASFASSVLIGRLCSQDEFGAYALALSVLLLARGIQSEIVSAPYLIYCHRRRDAALARYVGSSLIHQAISTLAVVLAVGGLAAGIAIAGHSDRLASALSCLAVAAPFILLREHLRQISFSQLRLAEAVLLDAIASTIQLGMLGWLAWQGELSVTTVYAAMGVGCAVSCLGWFARRPMRISFDRRDAWKDWRSNWEFGRWTLASHLVARAMSYLAPWIVAVVHGEAATGLMAACITIVNLVGMFVTGVSNYLTPRAARAFQDGGHRALWPVLTEALAIFVISVGSFSLFLMLTGDWFTRLVYGAQYSGTGAILLILSLRLLADSIGIVAGNGLWAVDRPRANFVADAATLVSTAAMLTVLVSCYGVVGAACGLLLGTLVGTIVRVASLWRAASEARVEHPLRVVPGDSP